MPSSRRRLIVAVVLVALAAGAGLAAVLGGEAEPERDAGTAPRTATANGPATERTEAPTGTRERTATEQEPPASPRDEQAIERAVSDAVAATEQGRPPPGIEPGSLPGSDELSFDSVLARGDRGDATLSSGAVVELRRVEGEWRIVGVRAP
jgi:hypothetical protein